jgi:hypothetical protein
LPARFAIRQAGWLHPYPLRVEPAAPVLCQVSHWTETEVRLSLRAVGLDPSAVTINLGGRRPGAKYAVEVDGDAGELVVRHDEAGDITSDDRGVISFAAQATPAPIDAPPQTAEGLLRSADRQTNLIQVVQTNGDGILSARLSRTRRSCCATWATRARPSRRSFISCGVAISHADGRRGCRRVPHLCRTRHAGRHRSDHAPVVDDADGGPDHRRR